MNYSFHASQLIYLCNCPGESSELRVSKRSARVEGLRPATRYSFSVAAENKVGRSDPSTTLYKSTEEEAPTGFPRNVKVGMIFFKHTLSK